MLFQIRSWLVSCNILSHTFFINGHWFAFFTLYLAGMINHGDRIRPDFPEPDCLKTKRNIYRVTLVKQIQ